MFILKCFIYGIVLKKRMFNEENYKLSARGLLEILHSSPVCASFAARSLEWANFIINFHCNGVPFCFVYVTILQRVLPVYFCVLLHVTQKTKLQSPK